MKEIRIHGRGGQGVVLAAELLATTAFADGKFGQAFPAFGGERRGAAVQAFVRVDTRSIRLRHRVNTPDWILILDPSLLETVDVLQGCKPGGVALLNSEQDPARLAWSQDARVYAFPATRIALEIFNQPLVNPAMLGAWAAVSGELELVAVQEAFRRRFPGEMGEKNSRAARVAFDWCREHGTSPLQVTQSLHAVAGGTAWEDNPGLGAPGRALHPAGVVAPRTALAYATGTWRYHRPVFDMTKCNGCGFCEMYCPDGCVLVENRKYTPDYQYCKGCGISARECTPGAITMVGE